MKKKAMSYTKFYRCVWMAMKQRCENPRNHAYHWYGGRGIKCFWKSFEEFKKDMYPSYLSYLKKHPNDTTIERIDVNGHYCKENCRWATYKEQANNRNSSVLLRFEGETKTMIQWADEKGMKIGTLWARISRGWSVENALTKDVRRFVQHN